MARLRLRTAVLLGVGLGLSLMHSACGSSPSGAEGPFADDGFAGGTKPLRLEAAPPGLCSGSGSDKECSNPDGCDRNTDGSEDGYPPGGATGGSGGGYNGGGATGGSGAYGGGAGAGPVTDAGAGGSPNDAGSDAEVCSDAGDAEAGTACGDGGTQPEASASARWLEPQGTASCTALDHTKPYTMYLSADDSNSTASPVIARRMIRQGQRVPAWLVRSYEFLNYYDFSFQPAEPGAVRIVPQLSSCPKNGELSFQVALQAEYRDPTNRAPLNVTFVLDTSGSMSGSPIELERAAVLAMASQLKAGDVVSMVTWSTSQVDILSGHQVTGPNDPQVVGAAQAIESGGGTDLHAGLVRGYALAEEHHDAGRINRVVLISDGQANVGVTDEELIGSYADDEEGSAGIYLSGIGVGDGVNDTLMNTVTDVGRGAYVYLDSEAEAQKMLGDRFLQVIDVAARAVRLEMTLPWYMQIQKFYGEEASPDPTKVRPQHLGPNDAMLFFQVLQACDPSLIHGDDRIRLKATWQEPFTRRGREAVVDTTLNALAGSDDALAKAAAIASYSDALIAVEGAADDAARRAILTEARGNVNSAAGASSDPDLIEVRELLETYLSQFGG